MSSRLLLTACATAALAGAALAQTAQPAPTETVPGWAGTPSPGTGQAGGPGMVAIDPRTVVVQYYATQPADLLASNIMDLDVYNLEGEQIGEVEDLVIDQGRTIGGVVVSVGGFLGLGERYAALPPSSIVLARQPDGSMRAIINTSREQLRGSPEFRFEGSLER
jgi:sporulation protein YlmC with PRC-barrel domain